MNCPSAALPAPKKMCFSSLNGDLTGYHSSAWIPKKIQKTLSSYMMQSWKCLEGNKSTLVTIITLISIILKAAVCTRTRNMYQKN